MKFLVLLVVFACSICGARDLALNQQNTVTLRGVITRSSAETVMAKLALADMARGTANYTLYLTIDSPGGDIEAGLTLIEFAKSIKNLKTVTIFAASMASAIVQALPGERLIVDTGVLMFHRAKGTFSGQFENGEVESELNFAKKLVLYMERTNAKRMKLSLREYKNRVRNEYWIMGNESLKLHAADAMVNILCTPELMDEMELIYIPTPFGEVSQAYSRCPLFREGHDPEPKKTNELNLD